MTDKQLAIAYVEEATRETSTQGWNWDKDELEELAKRKVDVEKIAEEVCDMFGSYILDADGSTDDYLDFMFNADVCDYLMIDEDKNDFMDYEILSDLWYWEFGEDEEQRPTIEDYEEAKKTYKQFHELIEKYKEENK